MTAFADGEVEPRRWRTFENLACLARTESSNDLARELIELYFNEDQDLPASVLVAESQPSARGRTGPWRAPAGQSSRRCWIRPSSPGRIASPMFH